MERRREHRIECDQAVELVILDGRKTASETRISARIVERSGRGLRLVASCPIPCGVPVKLIAGDVLLLGEICYSAPGPQGCVAGVQIDQILTGLQELTRLNRALLGTAGQRAAIPSPVTPEPVIS